MIAKILMTERLASNILISKDRMNKLLVCLLFSRLGRWFQWFRNKRTSVAYYQLDNDGESVKKKTSLNLFQVVCRPKKYTNYAYTKWTKSFAISLVPHISSQNNDETLNFSQEMRPESSTVITIVYPW
jgi:hypothetical protein